MDTEQDITGQAIALLGLTECRDAAAEVDVDARALALLQVALTVLVGRAGRERTVGFVDEALNVIDAPERERAALMLAATPAEQLADTLLGFLRGRDATDPGQALGAHGDAGAMILAGLALLQERHGGMHMCSYADHLIRILNGAVASGQHPVSAPAQTVPVLPAPDVVREALDRARVGIALRQRIEAMVGILRSSAPAEGHAHALSSAMAAGLFLREQRGEAFTVDTLRQVEGAVSQIAALDRWQPPEGAHPN